MISHAHRAIFFHIPKAAGSSIELKLQPDADSGRGWQDHRTVRDVRPLSLVRHARYLADGPRLRRDGLGRRTIVREMVGAPVAPGRFGHRATRKEFATYYKFAVVRNPWARVHSWYRNVQRDPEHGVPACDFATFLTDHADNWALRPQLHWLEDFDGSIPLDRIVRFENLAEEMRDVFQHLGFDDLTLPHALDAGPSRPYQEAYTSALADLVGQRYRREIERFDYSF